MITARIYHTATLLPSGTVLVAGGLSLGMNGGPLASAELYDPTTGIWSAAGSMTCRRTDHTATLLPNGSVLVVGGSDDHRSLACAELYDPATGTWTVTGSLAAGRAGATATLLPDGKVLLAGGADGMTVRSSAELYDPATGIWTPTGGMAAPRSRHTATLLANGQVLVAGGVVGWWPRRHPQAIETVSPEAAPSAELYDPVTGSWAATGEMVVVRIGHTATLLPNGDVLVAGGDVFRTEAGTRGDPLDSAELYHPATGTWIATQPMSSARDEFIAALLPDGTVLVAGGFSFKGPSATLASAERYDPRRGSWLPAEAMSSARTIFTSVSLVDHRVLVVGGDGGLGALASAELYDPDGS